MKKRTIPIIFIIIVILLTLAFFITQKLSSEEDNSLVRAKIVTPKSQGYTEVEAENYGDLMGFETIATFVELLPNETLINSLSLDINDDGYDDEAIVVKKSTSPNLIIVAGIFNPETKVYDRLPEIHTNISRIRTFSYQSMDITGEHKTSLVYQGVDDEDNYVMRIFLGKNTDNGFELEEIGNFVSDGTIFIQQTERSDSYALNLSKGESYSVWVYKSDLDENDTSGKTGKNQLQQEYTWNPTSRKYEMTKEIKVAAGRLAAKELSRIQDGTVETFANFLNGLWYKTSNDSTGIRYIYFDYENKEVILLVNDTEEVYEWENSKLRHNGIYLTTVNSAITSLHRRYDVALINVDEIKITIRDEINLVIKETNLWDGNYKKLNINSSLEEEENKKNIFLNELEKDVNWATVDGLTTIKMKDSVYNFVLNGSAERGIYSMMEIGSHNVIQFRADSTTSLLNNTYALEFGQKTVTEKVKRKTVEKVVTDYKSITFTPVKITPTDCFVTEGRSFTFIYE